MCLQINITIDESAVSKKNTYTIHHVTIQEAIKHSKINNSTGPDNINISNIKHLGSIEITFLTQPYTIALINTNIIPQM